ncbi:class Ib ribonucleoside-diphosphate reductase assembly flavoprotein NrdI [Bacillus sp. 165]|uniref:class Ib ribonucleoside-diphosphate reductase assembly flavoprotein NrdI n=1 Tax=Bacillus sp. 165 TaxID=1529117 RepID=UPI001ADBA7AE|nr:class Ib ribonucleoside-diphosphate reductase assembly flavoprotein NrdI [Bacillus sp. 165]MBO9128427.1 class Ib ribonucleoside-diphosphate reductase assembly flavoprotein NrdI [Bacillus sp. 165]
MVIVYDSMTGNVERFIYKIDMPAIQLKEDLEMSEEYVLVTYTTGFGAVPERVDKFLQRNHPYLKGVSASGNRNWGDMFGASADKISNQYKVPVLSKFEMAGTNKDVEIFKERVQAIATH